MRHFNHLDPNNDCDPPDHTRDEHGYLNGAPIHDTDGRGSFPGPSLEDEMEEEFEAERQATTDADVRRAFNAGLAIPDLEVPPPTATSWFADVAMNELPLWQEIVRANSASFVMVPKPLMDELKAEFWSLLSQYHYNSQGSDYVCAFCGERPRTNMEEIKHRDDCFGIKLKEFFEGQDQGDDH